MCGQTGVLANLVPHDCKRFDQESARSTATIDHPVLMFSSDLKISNLCHHLYNRARREELAQLTVAHSCVKESLEKPAIQIFVYAKQVSVL